METRLEFLERQNSEYCIKLKNRDKAIKELQKEIELIKEGILKDEKIRALDFEIGVLKSEIDEIKDSKIKIRNRDKKVQKENEKLRNEMVFWRNKYLELLRLNNT